MPTPDITRGTCGYCGKTNVLLNSTPESNDAYCKDCLRLMMLNCQTAIKEINEYEKTNKIIKKRSNTKITEDELAKLEREKDKALEALMQEKFY